MRKGKIIGALALTCGLTLGVGYASFQANADTKKEYQPTITSNMQGETLALLDGDVAKFALNYTKRSAINYRGAESGYYPKPATISWENSRDGALYYTLKVGLEEDLSDANSYLVSETSADIDYLYVAKHYYYQVYAHYDNDEVVKSRVFDFYTADTPRTVYIDGVNNTRDIGGRYVMNGQYQVKQGMVYRGAEVDRELGAITEEGRRVMLYDLGIKTDLDIRGGDVQNAKGTARIDDSLNYVHLEAPWYSHVFNSSYKDAFATEIRTFANPDNYPIYFHCSVGRDRAGTLSMLLGALLGVDEVDLYRDYEMSFFSGVGLTDAAQSDGDYNNLMSSFEATINTIKSNYPADTFMESVEAWMKAYLGITQDEIDAIRNNLWEETDGTRVDNSAVKRSASRVNSPKAKAAVTDDRDFPCTYSANPDKLYKGYGSSTVTAYTAEEAAAAGIPAGYEGTVLNVTTLASNASVGCGVLLDYTAENIPLGVIESLQFRVYIGTVSVNEGTAYPQIRIANPNGDWVYQVNKANTSGEWITVTIPYNSKFEAISNNGNLATFELSLRTKGETTFYVDSAKCIMKKPVITYTGEDTLSVSLGKSLYLPATATDALGNALELQYVWEDGVALNANGTPTQMGTYALTVKAVDAWGNETSKAFTVVVEEAGNTTPPTIHLNYETVKAMVGAKSMLSVDATDDNGKVDIVTSWSNGALDKRGNLTAGEHIWTITATDKYGNAATKTVTFVVTESEPAYTYVVDEADEVIKYTVTFDGENAITVPEGFKVTKPANPVKETTAEARYTFLGWYVGDVEWDFNNVVTSDLDIQSKWNVEKRSYKVTFDGKSAGKNLEYGSLIPESYIPEDPTKASTIGREYVFEGWYLGDVKWNFETDVVTGPTALVAKFTAVPRLYTVTFDGGNEQQCEYGGKVTAPETPVKESTATHSYEFIGWYYGDKKWDFDKDVITYTTNLVSKWNEVPLDVEEPSTSEEPETPSTSETPDDSSDMAQPGGIAGMLSGCMSVTGGIASGLVALGVAVVAILKKKEN